MKRLRSTLVLAVGAAVLASGCVEEQGSVFISGALRVAPEDECIVTPGGTRVPSGVVDLGQDGTVASDYTLALEVVTNLPATFTSQDVTQAQQEQPNYPNYGNADANVIIFQGAEVFFTDEQGDPVPQLPTNQQQNGVRESVVGGSVFNVQTTLNASSVVFVPLLTSIEAQRLANIALTQPLVGNPDARATIIGNVRMIGRTTGGSTVRSTSFPFPLEICRNCLFRAGADANGDCPPGTTLQPVETCHPGQDTPSAVCLP